MRIREAVDLVRTQTGRRWLVKTARSRLHSRRLSVGVRRDTHVPFTPPKSKIPLVIRHVQPDDDLSFIADVPGLSTEAAQHRADQRWLLSCGLPTCWVGVDSEGIVRYMAWLLMPADNELIRSRWGDWLPQLKPDEALIEGVYTSEEHRGLGIMTDVSHAMAEQARELGVRYVMGFIGEGNAASLRVAEKANFLPYLVREDTWFLFRRRIRFLPYTEAAK